MTARSTLWKRKERRRLKRMFGNRCYFCGDRHRLEFAHVRPTALSGMGRGSTQRIKDVRDNTDKYLLTCRLHNSLAELNE